eukprot:gnl/TRDRNA2_/TRDRNA2_179160_c0_seq1.p1 gnl/TRDRNA2_/TRDRNA2_179160_c0~~gnl/TRDRNA2_/TRDRNA2_179160_c0_seq1.p1  ORF type:complete len:361 (+),score=48.45 gnl/TRDRNA2_/TRDRNA2_179160_c0_seq1:171-1253(+)
MHPMLATVSIAVVAALAAAAVHTEMEEACTQSDARCETSDKADSSSLNLLQTKMTTTRVRKDAPSKSVSLTEILHVASAGQASRPAAPGTPVNRSEKADPAIFMLTVLDSPPNVARAERCRASCTSLGYVNVSTVEGIQYHKFYPSDHEIAAQNWSRERIANETSRANSEIFKVFEQDQPNATQLRQQAANTTRLPRNFKEVASRSLSPGQVAVYLGHRRFWERVALMTNGSWSLLLEDDAHLNVKPSALAEWLDRHQSGDLASFVYLRPQGCNGGKFWIPDLMGYAIQPETARVLLANARADVPVDWAISHLVADKHLAGFCSETSFIQSDPDWRTSTKSLMALAAELHESNERTLADR